MGIEGSFARSSEVISKAITQMKYFFAISLFLVFCNISRAQINISGTVLDANTKEKLPGAHVLLPASFHKSIVTDQNGYFTLNDIQQGDTIIITFTGYIETIILAEENATSAEITLQKQHIKLKEVTVKSAVLGAENFAFTKLEPIDIYQNPTSKADALVAVNTSVASTTTDENAAVSFRGASPNQTGYFLNGVPVKNPVKYAQLTNTGTLSIFNTDFLKKVTVFPGNPPIEYGQSTSGTIVLETADRFPSYWQHTASVSMANAGYSARGALGKQTFLGVFANYQFDDALKAVNPSNFENINAFNSVDAGILLSSHQKWGSIKFYQYALWDNYNFQYQHPSYQNGFLQEAIRSISTLQWIQEFANWQISAVAGNSFVKNQFNFGNLNFEENNIDPYGALHFTWIKKGDLFKTGYSYWLQKKLSEGEFPTYDYALRPEHPSEYSSWQQKVAVHEVYSFYRKKIQAHSFGSGIRLGYLPELNKQLYSYQLNYMYTYTPHFKMKAGLGRYYQVRNTGLSMYDYANQSSIDFIYNNSTWAIEQSFYYNFEDRNKRVRGTETRITYQPNSKLQLDQSLSFIDHHQRKNQWFVRSFIIYKPVPSWSVNASYQSFTGAASPLITNASFNNELDVYAPFASDQMISFSPYNNLSLGINKLFKLGGKANGIAFISVNNLVDTKNTYDITYNFNYTDYQKAHLTRRSIYAGIIFNFIKK